MSRRSTLSTDPFYLINTSATTANQTRTSPHRAWAEINLSHLRHNVSEIKRIIPGSCGIIAVVKANAYGHGAVEIARCLNGIGITRFAVAEINEAILLRERGVYGDILILGYTAPERAPELARYKLIQTIVNLEHAESLESRGIHLDVHIKIDTGMNRLGEPSENLESIRRCYQFAHLRVTGTFSHLAESPGLSREEIHFTNLQVKKFNRVIDTLKASGLDPGLVHIQSSYGILNYPGLIYDLVRPGIALYGLLSSEEDRVTVQINLRPVISLKASVTQVKEVPARAHIGYGHAFIAPSKMKIAVISLGYADGIPRALSEQGGYVLIRGQRAAIIGGICMDQFMVDVTSITDVGQGDTATIIGQDGKEVITAGQIARRCGTVTNEILSRLGDRVERVYNT
ncbi:serine racemase VanT catalytic subunit [Paenibacillus tuaregi]|uniref:serine racemase VanT catalytic subunit n=1 Tax=Paenibacillus tuaregi TaxID=1816681 RepID=UPI0009EE9F1A|nr:serine racemase VanT catalytic subunit [Paenibacillus tuaregi]